MIANVCRSIKLNFNAISLDEAAQRLDLSSSYFSRIFKEITGMTWREYMLAVKIEKGKELLRDPLKSIKEIAYELGYNNPAHFSLMFKRRVGLSPTEYRKVLLG